MKIASGHEERRARIEIVALIDVIFLLLVFFIYAMLTMNVQRGISVSLPRARGETAEESLVIILDRESRLYLDERLVEREALVREVVRRGRPVLIRGDRRADLGVAVELLARLGEEGVASVSFQVDDRP